MTDFVPSDLQAEAIRAIRDWFTTRTHEQQVFRVFGYAGSGKTTITRHAIADLGLDTMMRERRRHGLGTGGVLYAAFTGKAALVMSRKGTPGLDHPQPDLPGLGGDPGRDRAGQARRSPRSRRRCPASVSAERTPRGGAAAQPASCGWPTSTSRASSSTSSRSSATPR